MVPVRELRLGSRGDDVGALQRALKKVGEDPGRIDGVYGPSTEIAVRTFQTRAEIRVDGIVGPETRAALARALVVAPEVARAARSATVAMVPASGEVPAPGPATAAAQVAANKRATLMETLKSPTFLVVGGTLLLVLLLDAMQPAAFGEFEDWADEDEGDGNLEEDLGKVRVEDSSRKRKAARKISRKKAAARRAAA